MDSRFIGEPIEVEFDRPPAFSKRPHCPDRIIWEGERYVIVELLEQRVDFGRRGRMADNMRPEHLTRAMQTGSWGVGRFWFTVRVAGGRVFEIYYDRAPKSADVKDSGWTLRAERI